MDQSSRINKSSAPSIKETTSQENSATPAADQSKLQTGIASKRDSFEATPADSIFTANPNTGQLNFGNGIQGKTPPVGNQINATYRYQGLLQESKTEIANFLKGEQSSGEPFKAISAYLKMTQKETREDRGLHSAAKEMSLMSKSAQLSQQNQKIDAGMKEAGEKAENAMNAATSQMATGIAQGFISIGAAAGQLQGLAAQAKGELAHLKDPAIELRYARFTSLVSDLQKAGDAPAAKKSDQMQKEINNQEKAINKAQQDSADSSHSSDSAQNRKEAMMDNIQKFLDILRSMNPQI